METTEILDKAISLTERVALAISDVIAQYSGPTWELLQTVLRVEALRYLGIALVCVGIIGGYLNAINKTLRLAAGQNKAYRAYLDDTAGTPRPTPSGPYACLIDYAGEPNESAVALGIIGGIISVIASVVLLSGPILWPLVCLFSPETYLAHLALERIL